MKRILAALFLLATACSCGAVPKRTVEVPPADRALAREEAARAVAVAALCGEAGTAFGSGVIVGPSTVLTALHVVGHCENPVVLVQTTDEKVRAVVVTAKWSADVARLELVAGTFDAPVLERGPRPEPGDRVCVVAAVPDRLRRCGEVDKYGTDGMYHSAPVQRGNSGGGVYDSAGRLVGVTTMTIGDGMGGVAAPLEGLGA
jgi:S1-C subfamily serine protease